MPTKKPSPKPKQPKYFYMNAYLVVRKAPRPGPHVRVANHGTVLGSLRYPAGNHYKKKKAQRELQQMYEHTIRGNGQIYKNPHAAALWIYEQPHPAENWVDCES